MSDEGDFLRLVTTCTPAGFRRLCDLIEEDPRVTPDLLRFAAKLRAYAEQLEAK